MKKRFIYFMVALFFLMISCKNSKDHASGNLPDTLTFNANNADEMQMPDFYELQTNWPVDVMQDTNTHQYVDVSTHKPLTFYYDAVSHDTFDIHGRIINNALVLINGKYSIDEAKVKSKDDSFKIRTDKMKIRMEGGSDKN